MNSPLEILRHARTLVADYGESVDDALYHASANVGWETYTDTIEELAREAGVEDVAHTATTELVLRLNEWERGNTLSTVLDRFDVAIRELENR